MAPTCPDKDSLSGPHFGDFPILSLGLSDYPVVYLGARFGFPGQKIADDHDHLTFFLIFIGGDGFLFMGLRANYFFMRSLLRQIGRKKKSVLPLPSVPPYMCGAPERRGYKRNRFVRPLDTRRRTTVKTHVARRTPLYNIFGRKEV